ncbi:hypothetical protein CLW00_10388 [Mongoliibacter ruber]|uniref:Uncharacterized protein n=1 Tax=Mongoliibacter ruber TaxID=1750599 RepID=A0A2T0WQI5_9BACT|nr:hypothetical protein CLW00_10388 [Mongoliibacter ruber]
MGFQNFVLNSCFFKKTDNSLIFFQDRNLLYNEFTINT